MPDIKVKGYSGGDLEYKDVDKVWLTPANGATGEAETILEEQELPFAYEDGVYMFMVETSATFSDGDIVTVTIDGTEYERTAFTVYDTVVIGNTMVLGVGEDTGEPFIIGVEDGSLLICTTLSGDTHTVSIVKGATTPKLVPFTYGEVLEGVEVSPDFSNGDEKLSAPTGKLIREATILKPENLTPENIVKDVEIAGVVGAYIPKSEEVTVELNMADGDQVVEQTSGVLMEKVTITKPETLIPENVAEGIDIAGIIGTLVAGGGGSGGGTTPVFAGGTFTGTGTKTTQYTITHGLGVVPDIVFIRNNTKPQSSRFCYAFGMHTDFVKSTALGDYKQILGSYMSSNWMYSYAIYGIDTTSSGWLPYITNANEKTVSLSSLSSSCYCSTADTITWFAIGGLMEH